MVEPVGLAGTAGVSPASHPTQQAAGGTPAVPGVSPSAAAHGRHDELVAPAGAALDLFAAAELKVAGQAYLDVAEAPATAGNRNALGVEPRIGLDESLLDLLRRDRHSRPPVEVLGRSFHHGPGLADRF